MPMRTVWWVWVAIHRPTSRSLDRGGTNFCFGDGALRNKSEENSYEMNKRKLDGEMRSRRNEKNSVFFRYLLGY